ncbi:hypothetical protein [Actinacidiphila sp. bgisy145]
MGHRGGRLAALGLAAACGLFVVPASHAEGTPPSAFVRTAAAQQAAAGCRVTLPGGIGATVTADGARLTDPAAGENRTLLSFRSGGHQYLVPANAATAKTGLAPYDTTALAERTCGTGAFTPKAATPATASRKSDAYRVGRLTVHLVDTSGQPTTTGELYLIDVDHTAYDNTVFNVPRGSMKLSVPTGHYELMYIEGTHITIAPDVAVGDGTSVTLDARTSTHTIPVPATPRPATVAGTEFTLYRSDGSPGSDTGSVALQVLHQGSDLSDLTFNTTSPVTHGRFQAVVSTTLTSPADAARPYTYHLADSYDHLPSSYPASVDAKSLATVEHTFSAPTGPSGWDLLVQNVTPVWAARAGVQTAVGFNFPTPGSTLTDYVSATPGLTWRTQLEDEQTEVLLSGADTAYRAGEHRSVLWEGDAPQPGVQVDTGLGAVNCGACATADTLVFGIGEDGDSTPGTVGVGYDDSGTTTLTRDGTLQASGDGNLFGASVAVPAGKATYRLRQQITRSHGTPTAGTDTTWTFTADPGKGQKPPSDVATCDGLTTSCAALPLLFASTSTDADLQHRLTTGRHTLDLDVAREQYTTGGQISGATAQVSYDGGKSWQDLRVTGGKGAYRAAYTVPASASGGTVSFRVAAWDQQGGRIDQTLSSAYQVR